MRSPLLVCPCGDPPPALGGPGSGAGAEVLGAGLGLGAGVVGVVGVVGGATGVPGTWMSSSVLPGGTSTWTTSPLGSWTGTVWVCAVAVLRAVKRAAARTPAA